MGVICAVICESAGTTNERAGTSIINATHIVRVPAITITAPAAFVAGYRMTPAQRTKGKHKFIVTFLGPDGKKVGGGDLDQTIPPESQNFPTTHWLIRPADLVHFAQEGEYTLWARSEGGDQGIRMRFWVTTDQAPTGVTVTPVVT